MVQVSSHPESSNSVEFAIIHQAVVPAARDSHPGHQVPVVQKWHVAPHICHCYPWLCTTWKQDDTPSWLDIAQSQCWKCSEKNWGINLHSSKLFSDAAQSPTFVIRSEELEAGQKRDLQVIKDLSDLSGMETNSCFDIARPVESGD